jgi:DNA-binding MarR family transcriptional regulator
LRDANEPMAETAEVSGAALAPELTRYLVYLMRRVFAQVSTDPTDSSAHSRDFVILAVLGDQDAFSQQELAERLDINRTIMVKLIDRLERAGFVTRTRNPKNRRSYVLSLTDAGRRELAGMRRAATERDERFTAALTPAARQRLNDLLRTLLGEHDQVMASSLVSSEYLISQVFYQLRRRGDAILAGTGLRLRHFAPLFAIERFGPCPQQQLASYLAITKPAAAQTVEELVQADLVARGQDPVDRRRYALELTELGRKQFAAVHAAMDRLQAELAEKLGPGGDEELRALLGKLLPEVSDRSQPAHR